SGFDIFSSLRRAECLISTDLSRIAAGNQERMDSSAVTFGGRFLLLLSFLARGIARVALELALVFEPLFLFALTLQLGLSRQRFEPRLLLPGGLFRGAATRFSRLLFRLSLGALGVAHLSRFENRLPLGLALHDRRVCRIIFRIGEKLFRHRLARLGGRGLAVSESIAVQERHWIPIER